MSQERTTTTQVTAASIQLWLRIKLQNNNNNRGKCQEFELEILELPFIYFIHDMIPKSIQQAMFLLNNISNSTGWIRILRMSDYQNMLKAER